MAVLILLIIEYSPEGKSLSFKLTSFSFSITFTKKAIRKNIDMPLSLRIQPHKEKMIKKMAEKTGKTKSAFILEAVDEKLGIIQDRKKMIRDLAGWLSHEEAEVLRNATNIFNNIDNDDWT